MKRALVGVVGAVTALLLAGCSGTVATAEAEEGLVVAGTTAAAVANPAPGATLRHVSGDQRMRLDLPTTGTVRGVALYFHGQWDDVDGRMDDPWLDAL